MAATLALAALALYLLIGEPLLGHRAHRRLVAALDAGASAARQRFYRQWTWQGWALLAATLLVTLGLARWTPTQLGLAAPRMPTGSVDGTPLSAWLISVCVGFGTALLLGAVLGLVQARRGAGQPAAPPRVPGGTGVLRMLPRTAAERWGFAALAITAGITEEVIWRGFGQGLALQWLPHAPLAVPVAIAALAFGWAHLYQGWLGMLLAAVLGGLFGALYLATGSLLVPIVLHVLIDLRALLLRVPPVLAGPAP